MDSEYWLQRWREGRTGWHNEDVLPLLQKHWPGLGVPRGTRVLVPLCGKSLDMLWLAAQGLQVCGVELAPQAVKAFLDENQLQADVDTAWNATRYRVSNAPAGGGIDIFCGDLFDLDPTMFEDCNAFYDRAASIALPAPMRERLTHAVYAKLPAGSRGLLIVLDYPAHEKEGPPFSIDDAEVHRLFAAEWNIETLERRDILASQPRFIEEGVTALHTAVCRLARRGT